MTAFRTGVVTELLSERAGLQRVLVEGERAYVLTQLIGPVAVGDRVVMNTTAVDLGLGTGGWHVVHWNLARDSWHESGNGPIMKLRYTSLQVDTGAAEEQHPDVPSELDGMPVVAISVHSQLAPVAAAFAPRAPAGARLVYVMTDAGARPLALSDLVATLVDEGLLAATVTCGQAFGGELEAVNVPSALAVARHVLDADAVVIGTGPGVVGTATRLGTSALDVVPALTAAATLGGQPVLCLRASQADARPRHRPLSHHSLTAMGLLHNPVTLPAPASGGIDIPDSIHDGRVVDVPDMAALLDELGVAVTTMGRTPADDPTFFAWAGAAGVVAADLVSAATQ